MPPIHLLALKIILEGGDNVERYINFLKSGGSEYPLDQLRAAGVDMERKESVDDSLGLFSKTREIAWATFSFSS